MGPDDLLAFLRTIDAEVARHAVEGETLDLYLIGRSALILGYGLRLLTKDVDVVEVKASRLLTIAIDVFKRGGPGHTGHGFYLEAVSSGFPPRPGGFERRSIEVPGPWRVIRPMRPEAHDLVVTKLKRFHAGDREDVQILCDTGEVEQMTLIERFESAYAWSKPGDPKTEKATANLELVVGYLEGKRRTL